MLVQAPYNFDDQQNEQGGDIMQIDDVRLKSQVVKSGNKRHQVSPNLKVEIEENLSSLTRDQMKNQKSKGSYHQQEQKNHKKLSKFKDVIMEDYESQKPTSEKKFKSEV